MKAIKQGDWRAAEALLVRVFGRPTEKLEVVHPQSETQARNAAVGA